MTRWAISGLVQGGLDSAASRLSVEADGHIHLCQYVARIPASALDHVLLGSGGAAVTISSWPTVSLPNSTGTQAPIVTTVATVPKNMVGDPVYGSNRYGIRTPEKIRAVASPKKCPRPRSAVGNCSER